MAIYRLNVKVHSRGKSGKSSLSIASYRSEEKLKDEKLNRSFDYSKKNFCFHQNIYLPEGADVKLKNRELLWNTVEKVEKRKDAQLCREVVVALPKELTLPIHRNMVKAFCRENFTAEGMIADVSIHNQKDGNGNYHAHILLTTREIDGVKFGKKNRDWNRQELLVKWREKWAETVNNELKIHNKLARVDHRTLKLQETMSSVGLPTYKNNTYQILKNDVPRITRTNRENGCTGQTTIQSDRLRRQKVGRKELAGLVRQSYIKFRKMFARGLFRPIQRFAEREEQERKIREANKQAREGEERKKREEIERQEREERQEQPKPPEPKYKVPPDLPKRKKRRGPRF